MKNLNSYCVQELNNNLREVQGGFIDLEGFSRWPTARLLMKIWEGYHEGQDPNNPMIG